ncbi:MAG: PorT family protein [Chitinophagaceae bacterium]|nr:PorT family protein [Chitinophagaceae bacterium]MDP1762758.1 porin family protein [Sediminibacterium sp.]MDP1810199.1 porin family protein [Sediminibacterium sp.]MDP3127905.1 porin family protein [Sediminibacterium sp.]MDP3666858.1 porin family protein [Sediminibacterium sp.]
MHYLLRKQVVLLIIILLSCTSQLHAQKELYRRNHDDLVYYFGLSLGYNYSYLHLAKSPLFLQNDSIMSAEPGSSGGIAMGLLATARLSNHFQVRCNPSLIIGGSKYIAYTLSKTKPGEADFQIQSLPSTLVSFPFQLKFNSDRIGNFRTYMLGGIKFDMDLSSNSAARNIDDIIKLKRNDFGFELGMGFNFYLPFVTISPEIKISNGLSNIHQQDPNLKYSNVLGQILSRMVVFSVHFED